MPKRLPRDEQPADGTVEDLSTVHARWLFRFHRSLQRERLRAEQHLEQVPAELRDPLLRHVGTLRACERQARESLAAFAQAHPVGRWLCAERGIGALLAAALLAHLDITRASSYRSFWRYAGLTPDAVYRTGRANGWSRELRRICYLLGECLMRARHHEESHYGPLYDAYKAQEIARNARGDYEPIAIRKVASWRSHGVSEAYSVYVSGHLPPGHLHARARRRMVKDVLADLYYLLYWHTYGHVPSAMHRSPFLAPISERIALPS